ncbi:MAG: hypothetical protein BroJett029_34290 [Alphaproteobacteria bacterium]|nr:MAG: hypothetical protein BroJett029_34290 [Alphaproteobacteria bacterium]
MTLNIATFSNATGGDSFFKAIGHPLAVAPMRRLLERLSTGRVAVYDPLGLAAPFSALWELERLDIAAVLVQDVSAVGRTVLGQAARPITELPGLAGVAHLLVAAFDAARFVDHIRHLLPDGMSVATLDSARLPDEMLSVRARYLDPLNFATNFALFRDEGGHHTRLVTANYWSGYGARSVSLWLCLFDAAGDRLAEWRQDVPDGPAGVVIDSRKIRRRFGLPEFTGTLFVHAVGVAGHDVVKYALDSYGDEPGVLSCTHDANAWPADLYAGLPAPAADERVLLWVQNSHPRPIPAGAIGLNPMGRDDAAAWYPRAVPAFGTAAIDVAELLPGLSWPGQIEIRAGKHFVRPRYEVVAANGRRRIAHANVERTDLAPDPRIAELGNLMGKGFILPAPVLPQDRWETEVLPTPMATGQSELPISFAVYDPDGRQLAQQSLGRVPRHGCPALVVSEVLAEARAASNGAGGHLELTYDFTEGGGADGWLHGLFRYRDRRSGHAAETSFGAHVFNTVLTFGNEPQSYAGRAPGLSTRLFLRLGQAPEITLCHLIYPASTPWHAASRTVLLLHDADGREIARAELAIPCGGSRLWRADEMFGTEAIARAGTGGYVLVRDTTCRLFGYHILERDGAFALDHMFGF